MRDVARRDPGCRGNRTRGHDGAALQQDTAESSRTGAGNGFQHRG
jgi:hypothetical protein